MRRLLLLASALLICTPALAFRGRPLSDLRFDGIGTADVGAIASDGNDFMVLSSTSYPDDGGVYAQRVVRGVPVGPRLRIGRGVAAGLIWNGAEYLAAWTNSAGLWTARVSRMGGMIAASPAPVMLGRISAFASDGRSALAVQVIEDDTVVAQPLDLSGKPSGPAVTLNMPAPKDFSVLQAGPAAGGYALVSPGSKATNLRLVRADGTPLGAPMVVDGPYDSSIANRSVSAWIATDGTDTVVVIQKETSGADTQLKSVVLGADGTIKRAAQTFFTAAGAGERSLQPAGLVWTGSQYALIVAISKDPSGNLATVDPGVLRISRGGDLIGEVSYLTTGPLRKSPFGVGWNGSELLVPWFRTDYAVGLGTFCAALPLATLAPTAPAPLGRTIGSQSRPTIAASHGQYLAAWFETSADGIITVRASRIDAAGNYLDGDGIALGTIPTPPKDSRYVVPTIAADSDGANWLVAWAAGAVRARRISRDGALLEALPFPLGGGFDVAVRWTGASYVVASANPPLYITSVSREGVPAATKTLALNTSGSQFTVYYAFPSIAVSGNQALIAFQKATTQCFGGTPGGCDGDVSVLGYRLDSAGNTIDSQPLQIAKNVWLGLALAGGPTGYLIVWSQYDASVRTDSIWGSFMSPGADAILDPFRIATRAVMPAAGFDGHDFIAAWSSVDKTIGATRITSVGTVTPIGTLRLDEGEMAYDAFVAASADTPAIIAFLDRHPAYDDVWRGSLLFAGEFSANAVPTSPSIDSAIRIDANDIEVRWQPSGNALGTSIELQLSDGAYRPIGITSADATSARISLADLQGSAVRLRAWNAAGISEPSRTVPLSLLRSRAVRAH